MRKGLFFLTVTILVAALAFNPSASSHEREIAEVYSNENPLTGLAGVGEVLGGAANYNDYIFFSTTHLGRRMSVGIFGNVYADPPTAEELPSFVMQNLSPPVREELLNSLPEEMKDRLSNEH